MKKKIGIIALVTLVAVIAAVTIYAVSGYDNENDPLVSLSYIEKILMPKVNTEITNLKNEIAALKTAGSSDGASGYEVIKLTKGQTLLAKTALDIVVRSGDVVAVSPFTGEIKQGLNDYTTGAELLNGDVVPVNHYILVPRGDDGRGVQVVSNNDTYLVVRGGYEIVNAK